MHRKVRPNARGVQRSRPTERNTWRRRLFGVASLEDFDRDGEEHEVQPGQYGVAFASGLQTSPVARSPESQSTEGPTFTAEPERVDS
jgi:hypothetical protein